jgi:hypothetical protein
MKIRVTGAIRKNGATLRPGEEVHLPDEEAFQHIEANYAEPATRAARRVYQAMKKAHDAKKPPAGPDIRDKYVFLPELEMRPQVKDGRIVLVNNAR